MTLLLIKRVVVLVDSDVVLLGEVEELVRSQNRDDFDELVCVVLAEEEVLLAEDHRGEHAAGRPDVHREVVLLVTEQQFRALVRSGGDARVQLLVGVVELGKAPVDDLQLLRRRVHDDVHGLDVPVHDAPRVAEVQCEEHLVHVNLDVFEGQCRHDLFQIRGGNVVEHKSGGRSRGVETLVNHVHNVRPATQQLQDPDLSTDFDLAHRLQYLDDDQPPRLDIDPLEDIRVLPAAKSPFDLVLVAVAV